MPTGYSLYDLNRLIEHTADYRDMNREQLHTYYERFLSMSDYLVDNDDLCDSRCGTFYLQGFPHPIRVEIRQRLSKTRPYDKVYHLDDVHEAALFIFASRPRDGRDPPDHQRRDRQFEEFLAMFAELLATNALNPVAHPYSQRLPSPTPGGVVQNPPRWSLACVFCDSREHLVRSCPTAAHYLEQGWIIRNSSGKLAFPTGHSIPRSVPGTTLQDLVIKYWDSRRLRDKEQNHRDAFGTDSPAGSNHNSGIDPEQEQMEFWQARIEVLTKRREELRRKAETSPQISPPRHQTPPASPQPHDPSPQRSYPPPKPLYPSPQHPYLSPQPHDLFPQSPDRSPQHPYSPPQSPCPSTQSPSPFQLVPMQLDAVYADIQRRRQERAWEAEPDSQTSPIHCQNPLVPPQPSHTFARLRDVSPELSYVSSQFYTSPQPVYAPEPPYTLSQPPHASLQPPYHRDHSFDSEEPIVNIEEEDDLLDSYLSTFFGPEDASPDIPTVASRDPPIPTTLLEVVSIPPPFSSPCSESSSNSLPTTSFASPYTSSISSPLSYMPSPSLFNLPLHS
ncbi:hypothetical protein BJ322DRAFT_1019858 [Thelephora terrestris]|uniref:Uncharacterized protein n=1 Tax=Thelephora terrestris TaxID=56493 RepID=A0A9P6HHS1_9AGAM|nr:hypothetical protein BJ322DRAFT_1019858 [Thelephora terrestris]